MAIYLGLSSSLYPSLSAELVVLLERAIWLKQIGKYQDALAIYQRDLSSVHDVPVVLIEWSNLYLEHGRYGELYRLLEKPLQDQAHDQKVLDRPEWRLLTLQRVLVETRHKGVHEPAIAELERTKKWLWDLPVSEYSDIQVSLPSRLQSLVVDSEAGNLCMSVLYDMAVRQISHGVRGARAHLDPKTKPSSDPLARLYRSPHLTDSTRHDQECSSGISSRGS